MAIDDVSAGQLRAVELLEGETIQDAWIGGIAHGETANTTKIGGTLVLTDQRVIFRPVKLPVGTVDRSTRRWINDYGFAVGLDDDVVIEADPNRRAALVVRTADQSIAINISHSKFATMWSKKNVAARDDALAGIGAALKI